MSAPNLRAESRGEGSAAADEPEPRDLEREIDTLRGEMGELIRELDRRRHALTDLKLQAQRHPFGVSIVAGSVVAVLGLIVWMLSRIGQPKRQARKLAQQLLLQGRYGDELVRALQRAADGLRS